MNFPPRHIDVSEWVAFKNRKFAKNAIILVLMLIVAQSGILYSFMRDMPDLRRLWAYPLCALINILLVKYGMNAWRANISVAPNAMKKLLFLLLLWGGILIIRTFDLTPISVRNLFFNNWGAMGLFFPFLAVFSLRSDFWLRFCQYGSYVLAVGILSVGIMDLFVVNNLTVVNPFLDRTILFIAPLFYLTGFLRSKKYIYWGAFGLFLWLFFEFFADKRENVVLIGWFLFCSFFEMRRSVVFNSREKIRFSFVIVFAVITISVLGFQSIYNVISTERIDRRVIEFFFEGGAIEDTRSGAVDDFFRGMEYDDILVGRGAVATYQTNIYGLQQSFLEGGRRHTIEIGHLQHMLTGGLVLNVLFVWLALGGVFLGMRRSRNRFTHALAYIVLGWVLLMFVAATPSGSSRYFLVWLAIGGCWSKELRSMTTAEFIQKWDLLIALRKRKIL